MILNKHDLTLPYDEFEELLKFIYTELSFDERQWLAKWQAYDLALSPMDDNIRSILRYGHYLGWIHALDFYQEWHYKDYNESK